MPRLENWSIIYKPDNFKSPEQQDRALQGNVYNHPNFEDGKHITTSRVLCLDLKSGFAETLSRVYELGEMNQEYREFLIKEGENGNSDRNAS